MPEYEPDDENPVVGNELGCRAEEIHTSRTTRIRSSATNSGAAPKKYIGVSAKPRHKRLARHAPGATAIRAGAATAPDRIATDPRIPAGASQRTGPPHRTDGGETAPVTR
ncbi:hypothetical protein [Streptomyces anulatus]|uniref:hypothetical protein n=1 Tax=Streptomyces anulatus TaxID=1892 RepID=UPI00369509F1